MADVKALRASATDEIAGGGDNEAPLWRGAEWRRP